MNHEIGENEIEGKNIVEVKNMAQEHFEDVVDQYLQYATEERFLEVTENQVLKVLEKDKLSKEDLLALLSPAASKLLEKLAKKAQALAIKHFGKSIQLYTPLYLGNFCVNQCVYCGYNTKNDIKRSKLTKEEIIEEAIAIRETGLRHILLLTGEDPVKTSPEYIMEGITLIRDYFDSIALEIYPVKTEVYKQLVESGADSLTVYQETYDKEVYKKMHPLGPKANYNFRLGAPERAAAGGMRAVGIGALLGLSEWRRDAFLTAIHGEWLSKNYPETDLSISTPRLRPCGGDFKDFCALTDRELVQVVLAYRIFLPYAAINISTREEKNMRDHLIPLGITGLSAGVCTSVGGHAHKTEQTENKGEETTEPQFEISDSRSVEEMKNAIIEKGWQPVFKDWYGK